MHEHESSLFGPWSGEMGTPAPEAKWNSWEKKQIFEIKNQADGNGCGEQTNTEQIENEKSRASEWRIEKP